MPDGAARDLIPLAPPRIPYHPEIKARFDVDAAGWRALIDAVWPAAKTINAVVLALSYCRARNLDPFKRPVHIVPVWSSEANAMVESVWPGIGELRTTAFRTGLYAGRDATEFGPDKTLTLDGIEVTFPEWAQVTVYRLGQDGTRMPFPGPRGYWLETYATAKRDTVRPNAMWKKRPRGQLDKCAEAAALRAAFPEEIGEYAAEEMEGQVIEHAPAPPRPQREQFREVSAPVAATDLEETGGGIAEIPFEVVDFDGVVHGYTDAENARGAVATLIEQAKNRGRPAVEGLWESNAETVREIGEAIEDGAEPLRHAYDEALASFEGKTEPDPGKRQDRPLEGATQSSDQPSSMKVPIAQYKAEGKNTDWIGVTRAMVVKIKTLTDLADTAADGRFISVNRDDLDEMRRGNRNAWSTVNHELAERDRQLREQQQ